MPFDLVPFLDHLDGKRDTDCFTLIVFLMYCECKCTFCGSSSWCHWVALKCVCVVISDHTHFLVLMGVSCDMY